MDAITLGNAFISFPSVITVMRNARFSKNTIEDSLRLALFEYPPSPNLCATLVFAGNPDNMPLVKSDVANKPVQYSESGIVK